jgi:hypothetical protein
MEDDLKKMKIEDDLNFILKNKNDDLNKEEDNLKKKWKTNSKKNGRKPQK